MSTTDMMSDAWATGTGAVHDFATSAAERATELASTAAEQLEDLPEKVVGLAGAARQRIRPARRRSVRPWLFLAAAVAGVLVVAWWWRQRATSHPAVDIGPDGRRNPVRDAAASALGT